MGLNKQTVTLIARMNGGKQIEDESHRGRKAVKELGNEVKVTNDVAGHSHGFVKYEEQQKKVSKAAEAHNHILHRSRGLIENVVGAVGITAGAASVTALIKAGTAAETQESSLRGSLRRTGQLHKGTLESINKTTEMSAVHGGFTTNEQIQGITQFINTTHSATKAMKLNDAATNLARGTHMGLAHAQKILMQAQSGSVGQLQRYLGPIVVSKRHQEALTEAIAANTLKQHQQDQVWRISHPHAILMAEALKKATPAQKEHAKLLDKQANATKILGLIQGKFAGEQANYNKTQAAQLTNMHNSIDLTQAKVGKALLPVFIKLVHFAGQFASGVIKHWPEIRKIIEPIFKVIWGGLKTAVMWVAHTKSALMALGVVLGGLLVGWLLYKGIQLAINIVEGIGTMIKWAKNAALWAEDTALTAAIVGLYAYDAAQWLVNAATAAFPGTWIILALVAVGAAIYMAIKHWRDIWNVIKAFGKWIWDHPVFLPIIGPAIEVVKQVIKHWRGLVHFFEGLPAKFLSVGKTIGKGLWEGIKWGINAIIGLWEGLIHAIGLPGFSIGPIHFGGVHPFDGVKLPRLAQGGDVRHGGMALIGERGPEVLNLPTGARVTPLSQSGPGLGSIFEAASGDLHVHMEVEGKEIASVVLKDFRKKQARI